MAGECTTGFEIGCKVMRRLGGPEMTVVYAIREGGRGTPTKFLCSWGGVSTPGLLSYEVFAADELARDWAYVMSANAAGNQRRIDRLHTARADGATAEPVVQRTGGETIYPVDGPPVIVNNYALGEGFIGDENALADKLAGSGGATFTRIEDAYAAYLRAYTENPTFVGVGEYVAALALAAHAVRNGGKPLTRAAFDDLLKDMK